MHLCIRGLDFASIYEFWMMVIIYSTIYVTVYPIEFGRIKQKTKKLAFVITQY